MNATRRPINTDPNRIGPFRFGRSARNWVIKHKMADIAEVFTDSDGTVWVVRKTPR